MQKRDALDVNLPLAFLGGLVFVAFIATATALGAGGAPHQTASAGPLGAGEPTRWVRLCGTDSLVYVLGHGGVFARWDREYPLDTEVVAVRYDGNREPYQRACVSYLLKSPEFPIVAAGQEPPTDEPDLSMLTARQPMFDDAIDAARRFAGVTYDAAGAPPLWQLKLKYPRQYQIWGCQGGPDSEFFLYLAARWWPTELTDKQLDALRSKGDRFWNTVLNADYIYAINGCKGP